ncbi:hypothetical protein [Alienimonas chondri]|uniref:Lipoprotein n=1 Tax=Alienimonas chondri TaxID=2681879 RepID=A0ABX1VEW0_9PLAN|nr:hypothetical protein [Alienimonas chondri]NNJ26045.1 hypothetical protein [Alienimonas chondri]
MRFSCCLLLVLAASGCGDSDYQADFTGNTVPYFAQRQEVDAALSAPWEKFGMSLRVPRGFKEQPPPPKPTKEELEDEFWEPPVDKRQPTYLLDPLPGMKGAWQGPLPGEGEQVGHRWLYVLDTAGLKDDPVMPGLAPENFVFEIADRFARSMELNGRFLATPEPEQFKPRTFPEPPQPFAPPVQYRTPPAPLVGDFGDGQVHRVELYAHQLGGRTTIIALVMPEEAMIGPGMGDSRDLMLQTLEFGTAASGAAPQGGAPPAGGGPGF